MSEENENEMILRLGLDRKQKKQIEQDFSSIRKYCDKLEKLVLAPKLCRLNRKPKKYAKRMPKLDISRHDTRIVKDVQKTNKDITSSKSDA